MDAITYAAALANLANTMDRVCNDLALDVAVAGLTTYLNFPNTDSSFF